MTQKQVCQLDSESCFVGFTFADESPLEPGVYLLPAGAVDTTAPSIPEGKKAKWNGSWVYEDIPKPEPEPEPAPPTPEQIKQQIVRDTQNRLDAFARTRNYDSILSACTYATSTNPKFSTEGQYCVEARDATWAKLYELYDEVKEGKRDMPEGYEDIETKLPVLEWPNA
jgi:hypothetical protein